MLRSRRSQAVAAQGAAALVLALLAALLATTLSANLARLNLSAGFGFLLRPAGMRMGESLLPFEPTDSFLWAVVAAGVNTVRVSLAAIILATVLGTAVGIMRLGPNPLLRALTAGYVELFRNTPLLLQMLFWAALLLKLPAIRDAVPLGGWAFLSNRGLQVPALLVPGGWAAAWPSCAAAALVLAGSAWRGRPGRGLLAAVLVLAAGLWAAGATVQAPVRRGFGYAGGAALTPEFCAVLLGLVAYAGTFIAEVVRGGILSVGRGQWEAARSLGLRDGAILRRVVVPQALRVILPSLTSQYVGIIKNSSLAIAIGYPDLFWAVSTAINVTGHAIEGVAVLMAGYLLLTLGTAGGMGAWYRRVLLPGAR